MDASEQTVCFDLDGVIADGGDEVYGVTPPKYEQCVPILSTVEAMKQLRGVGVRIVIHSARYPSDHSVTIVWLRRNDVPFDALVLGKPKATLYVDDRSYPQGFVPARHASFNQIMAALETVQGRKQ